MVRRLVEIEAGSNATESQFFLEMERRASLQLSLIHISEPTRPY